LTVIAICEDDIKALVVCQRKELIKASLKMPALQNHHGDQFAASDFDK